MTTKTNDGKLKDIIIKSMFLFVFVGYGIALISDIYMNTQFIPSSTQYMLLPILLCCLISMPYTRKIYKGVNETLKQKD